MLEVTRQVNWVDVVIVIIFLRVCYIATDRGIPFEFFKILGTLLGTFLAFRYYLDISEFLAGFFNLTEFLVLPLRCICFILLFIAGYAIFISFRSIFIKLTKIDTVNLFSKWIGLLFGVARAFLLTSIVLCVFILSGNGYFKKSVMGSVFGEPMFKVAPNVYVWIWNKAVSKIVNVKEIAPISFERNRKVKE